MMTAQSLKDLLSDEDIRALLLEMGANFYYEDDDIWITDTICHHGSKPKLYYYKDTKSFHCYTECGNLDILGVVIGYKGFEENDLPKAISWICMKLNIDDFETGFGGKPTQISDWEFIRDYKKKMKKNTYEVKELTKINPSVLSIFQTVYHEDWLNEGISVRSMQKYNIMYCTWQQRIVIPHYDKDGCLIGVRGRALLEDDIERFGKYTPMRIGNKQYNHPLGSNLYGLDKNIEAIKRKRKIMLVESEKSVLQSDTMFGDDNFTVATCGSNLTAFQRYVIISLDVNEVIVGLDKQFTDLESEECKKWAKHITEQFVKPLATYVKVSILWDTTGLLDYKDAPTDKGKDTLLKLMDNKIYVGTKE